MNNLSPDIRNKQKALRVLIQETLLMSEPLKEELLLRIDVFTEDQIMELGRFFAREQEKRESLEEIFLQTTDELLHDDDTKKTQE